MRGERAVDVGTHRLDRDIHARQPNIVLGKFCHCWKIDVLDVGKRHLGVVAVMSLELAGVVIARKIEIVQARDNAVIDDPDDVRLLLVFRHPVDDGAVLRDWRRTEPFAIALHHLGQVKINLITRSILHQG